MKLLLFEDEGWQPFGAIVQTRPIYELRVGALTLRERLAAQLAVEAQGLCRAHLMGYYEPRAGLAGLLQSSEPLTLVNGRALDLSWLAELLREATDTIYVAGDHLLGARLSPGLASAVLFYLREQQAADALEELLRFARVVERFEPLSTLLVAYPWDIIGQAGEQIVRDLPVLAARLPRYNGGPDVTVRGTRVYAASSARIEGPLVLDARDGPILIDENAQIEPFSFIQGPCYIGSGALIASARIRAETSIGPVCRIGGEVEASTIQSFSNKHHDGFLGHSYMGEWVNIGAMTTNSDLKNNYGSIKVVLDGMGQIDSGQIKLGCFLADHVKIGIGVHLNGGTIIGIGSNIFGMHTAPKTIPPFTWGGDVFREYRIENMIAVARIMAGRRKREFSAEYEAMLRAVFQSTRPSRDELVAGLLAPRPAEEAALALAEREAVLA